METIEERADRAIYKPNNGHIPRSFELLAFAKGYELGATEQKDIDDAELLKLKSSWEKEAQINHDDEANYKQGFHDAIEKACEWLKNDLRKYGIFLFGHWESDFRKSMEEKL